jgi:hypothetical protein
VPSPRGSDSGIFLLRCGIVLYIRLDAEIECS